jgi:hypothetical protein
MFTTWRREQRGQCYKIIYTAISFIAKKTSSFMLKELSAKYKTSEPTTE